MVQVFAISISNVNNNNELRAIDVSSFSWFSRSHISEGLVYAGELVRDRTKSGHYLCVPHRLTDSYNFMCYTGKSLNGHIAVSVITDGEYPTLAGFAVTRKLMLWGTTSLNLSSSSSSSSSSSLQNEIDFLLKRIQNPLEVDKLSAVQQQLDETKEAMMENIEQILLRGEKLDDLITKTRALSHSSKEFYKFAKKQNQCCKLY